MDELEQLATLITARNRINWQITELTGRPALIGHAGEFIASRIFDIALEDSATAQSADGRFRTGPVAGRSVNVKWYAKKEGVLDIRPDALPHFYLVMTGPRSAALSSRGDDRPWLIDRVFLFEAPTLIESLSTRGVKIGVATSVAQRYWDEAEIFPRAECQVLELTEEQRARLKLLSSVNVS